MDGRALNDHDYVEGAPYWRTLEAWSDGDDDAQFIVRELEPPPRWTVKTKR